jgi:hypothetical protein
VTVWLLQSESDDGQWITERVFATREAALKGLPPDAAYMPARDWNPEEWHAPWPPVGLPKHPLAGLTLRITACEVES